MMTDTTKGTDLVKIAKTDGMLALLVAAAKNADAIATGALGTEKLLQWLMIPGRLVQAARNQMFLEQLATEFEALRAKGAIKTDYVRTEQAQACLQELLAALEEPPVDAVKFDLLKSLFLAACTEAGTSRSDVTPQLLMHIARLLNSGEILLMAATYRVAQHPEGAVERVNNTAGAWLEEMSKRSGLGTRGLVEVYEAGLMEKRLLTPRIFADKSGVQATNHFRLTDLGVELCRWFAAKPENSETANTTTA